MYILIISGISRFVSRRGVNDATSSVPLRGVYRIKFYVIKLIGRRLRRVTTYIIASSDRGLHADASPAPGGGFYRVRARLGRLQQW